MWRHLKVSLKSTHLQMFVSRGLVVMAARRYREAGTNKIRAVLKCCKYLKIVENRDLEMFAMCWGNKLG